MTGEITFVILRPKAGFAIVSDDLCESADLSAYSAEQLPDILDQRAAALTLENGRHHPRKRRRQLSGLRAA